MRSAADRPLVVLVLALTVVGILIFFSAALSLLPKGSDTFGNALLVQVVLGLGGGLVALYALSRMPLVLLKRYALHFFVFSLAVTALVFVPQIGVTANGATRWLSLGPITFQPSELLKIAYVVLIARILSAGRDMGASYQSGVLPFAVVSVVTAVLLLLQPDTDTLLVIFAAGTAMLFASGLRFRDIVIGALILVMGLGVLIYERPYIRERFETYLHPTADLQGAGYHITQSLIAVGSGEMWGKGFGQSVQKFTYLPEASSDAIFAVYAEEFGFVGAVLLTLLFLFFALRGMWVSARAHDLFGGLVALGLSVLIGFQAFMNIGGMIGLIPVGGLTLPFVSRGGSALLITLAMAGLLIAVSRTVRHT